MDSLHSDSYAHGRQHESHPHHNSSAYSASAQPDEDWTKISDLAERRRIQNRIAQRNYRKKLKRRLEDLERKAGSSSPSPEQESRELPTKVSKPKPATSLVQKKRTTSPTKQHQRSVSSTQHIPAADDWALYQSSMHSRSTTMSPPPLFYSSIESSQTPPSPQLPGGTFPSLADPYYQFPAPLDDQSAQYMWQDKSFALKQENPLDNEMAPLYLASFNPTYNNVDLSFSTSFPEQCLTPELCDFQDYSSAGSPSDFGTFPTTPLMMPLTPPYLPFET